MIDLIIVVGILIIIIRFFPWASMHIEERQYRKVLVISLLIYGAVVLYLTLFSRPSFPRTPDLIPFHWLWRFLKWNNFFNLSTLVMTLRSTFFTVTNYLLNVMLFVPLGYLGPEFWKNKSCKTVVLRALTISVVIEVCQMVFSLGYFEVDDLIANSFGAYMGWILWQKYLKVKV